jgi:hypothetical protein
MLREDSASKFFEIIEDIVLYVIDPLTVWNILIKLNTILADEEIKNSTISLGGNMNYYMNIMRGLAKKNIVIRQLF